MMTLLVQPKAELDDTRTFDADEIARETRGGVIIAAWSLIAALAVMFIPSILAVITGDGRWFAVPLGSVALVSAVCAFTAPRISERLSALFTAALIGTIAAFVGGVI